MTKTTDQERAVRLSVTITTTRMVHGTQFKRICKALEHLYYLHLFTSVPPYTGRSDVWESWLNVGTDLAVRTPPSAVHLKDRYADSVHSQPRAISITADGNPESLEHLGNVLEAIDSRRQSDHARDPVQSALAGPVVRQLVMDPLQTALTDTTIDDASGRFVTLAAQSVASLTNIDIATIAAIVTSTEESGT